MRDKMLEQINGINDQVTRMGSMVLESIEHAFQAFTNKDLALAEDILKKDKLVNQIEEEIEDMCVRFAVTQSPVASDLRRLVTVLKVVTDLERIGDYSCNISNVVLELGQGRQELHVPKLVEMEAKVKVMLDSTLQAYYTRDVELAKNTAKMDEQVDDMYEQIYHDLLLRNKEEAVDQDQIISYILVGRHLERIADHATNICERLIFMQTGEHVKY